MHPFPRPLFPAVALALVFVAACTQPATPAVALPANSTPAQSLPIQGTALSISSTAEVRRVPDMATMSTGVVTQGATSNEAMQSNAVQMQKIQAALKAAGVAEKDIQTSGINLNPQYQYVEGQPPSINGYQANNTLNVIVRDLKTLGPTLDALAANGANQINGPQFDINDKEAALDEARIQAIKQAQARAAAYAKALGLSVKKVISINEGAHSSPPIAMPMMAMARADKAAPQTPVSPGENVLSVSVDVVFELGK